MTTAIIALGLLLGALASGLHILVSTRDLTDVEIACRLLGGAISGLFCVMLLDSAQYSRSTIMLILLAGYVGGDLLGGRRQC